MRLYKKAIITMILISLATAAVAADMGSLGFTVTSESKQGTRTIYEAQDAAGRKFTLAATGEVSAQEGAYISRAVEEFYSWNTMEVSHLRITLTDDRAVVLVIPSRYEWDSIDLVPFIPSGMQFYISRFFEYDFRVKADNLFVRLRGQYSSEAQFSARFVAAVEDPAGFIERNDPEYILRALRDIDVAIAELNATDGDLRALGEKISAEAAGDREALRSDLILET